MRDTILPQKGDPGATGKLTFAESVLSARRRRIWREYLTGYLMVAPAVTLIFVFGIFPVAFALYVSVHKWRLVRSDILGIENYVDALDKLIYTLLFLMGAGCLYGAYLLWRRVRTRAIQHQERPWPFFLPSAVYSLTFIAGTGDYGSAT